ncbi:MAG: hypothetical protein AAGC43_00050 [Bacteroidota bacterium]
MLKLAISCIFLSLLNSAFAQEVVPKKFQKIIKNFANADDKLPWGEKNDRAPKGLNQFGKIIGLWRVQNESMDRKGNWSQPKTAFWAFKYIMDGYAIQDLYLKSNDGILGGLTQIRAYNRNQNNWTIKSISFSSSLDPMDHVDFVATEKEGVMIMKGQDKTDNKLRISFYDFKQNSFKWKIEYYIKELEKWLEVGRISAKRMNLNDFSMTE